MEFNGVWHVVAFVCWLLGFIFTQSEVSTIQWHKRYLALGWQLQGRGCCSKHVEQFTLSALFGSSHSLAVHCCQRGCDIQCWNVVRFLVAVLCSAVQRSLLVAKQNYCLMECWVSFSIGMSCGLVCVYWMLLVRWCRIHLIHVARIQVARPGYYYYYY